MSFDGSKQPRATYTRVRQIPYLDLRTITPILRPIYAAAFAIKVYRFIQQSGIALRYTTSYLSANGVPLGLSPWDVCYPFDSAASAMFTVPLVQLEDRRFFQHGGLDYLGICRAIIQNIKRLRIWQGGSTLTQQLVRNIFIYPSRSITRKLCEAIIAIIIEQRFPKTEILKLYCNSVVIGPGIRGFAAASRIYHRRTETQLRRHEVSAILGCLRTPSLTSPLRNPKAYIRRAHTVETILHPDDRSGTVLRSVPNTINISALKKPRLSRIVESELKNYNGDVVGASDDIRRVHLTLDESIQAVVDSILKIESKSQNVERIAAIVLDHRTGDVLAESAYAQGREAEHSPAIVGKVQPGSTFKTFALLAALEQGLSPDMLLESSPYLSSKKYGKAVWKVRNFRDEYRGEMALADAFEVSDNAVFARLAELLDFELLARAYSEFGLLEEAALHPSIVLGAIEPGISLVRLCAAYAAVANNGVLFAPRLVRAIEYYDGSSSTIAASKGRNVQFSSVSICSLKRLLQRTGIECSGRAVSGKSGTTRKSSIFAAYDDRLSVLAWVGFRQPRPEWSTKGIAARSITIKLLDRLYGRDTLMI